MKKTSLWYEYTGNSSSSSDFVERLTQSTKSSQLSPHTEHTQILSTNNLPHHTACVKVHISWKIPHYFGNIFHIYPLNFKTIHWNHLKTDNLFLWTTVKQLLVQHWHFYMRIFSICIMLAYLFFCFLRWLNEMHFINETQYLRHCNLSRRELNTYVRQSVWLIDPTLQTYSIY